MSPASDSIKMFDPEYDPEYKAYLRDLAEQFHAIMEAQKIDEENQQENGVQDKIATAVSPQDM
ncbi:hypothetical protein C0992_008710 [Termitomyces sp. T32_za158]|nr:hypothetical protein C0992_008710 [Termitomyces sp. T32_za158]